MMLTIALATLAYVVFLGSVLAFLSAARRANRISDRNLPSKALLAELEREKRRSAA